MSNIGYQLLLAVLRTAINRLSRSIAIMISYATISHTLAS